jgi:hypothetical protein
MASAGLLHPQVDEDLNAVDQFIRADQCQFRVDTNSEPLRNVHTISDVWGQMPPKGRLHVYVSVDATSEYFICLFGPSQDI